jgi:hypothetical protein
MDDRPDQPVELEPDPLDFVPDLVPLLSAAARRSVGLGPGGGTMRATVQVP